MKNTIKYVFAVFVLVAAVLPRIAPAASIPKLTLASCRVDKEKIRDWFYLPEDRPSPEFNSIRGPLRLNLEQVNVANEPGIAAFSVVTVRGYADVALTVPLVQRDLRNIAVNYAEGTYSIGYTPYDVSRTLVPPFNLLIEQGDTAGNAIGYLSFVPLQATAATPFRTLELDCRINRAPAEPVALAREELLSLAPATQFGVIHDLYRLRFTGQSNRAREITSTYLQSIGLSPEVFARVKAEVSAHLSARSLPPERTSPYRDRTLIVPEGDRCGDISVLYLTPVYDSVSLRQQSSSAEARQKALGYILSGVRCEKPARIYTQPNERTTEDHWRADTIVISPAGLIDGESYRATTFHLW